MRHDSTKGFLSVGEFNSFLTIEMKIAKPAGLFWGYGHFFGLNAHPLLSVIHQSARKFAFAQQMVVEESKTLVSSLLQVSVVLLA